jgi:hypothetical protein
LAKEKEVTRLQDKVNAQRRRLPMVRVEKDYTFDSATGPKSLLDLFEGKKQLIVYHFMFDPSWDKGCMGCTGWVDALGKMDELGDRDTKLVLVSRAPLEKLEAYRALRGWSWPWYSSFGSDFNYDFHATLDDSVAPVVFNYRTREERVALGMDPGPTGEVSAASVFLQHDGDIFHTWSGFQRELETRTDGYGLLDLTPYGRQEDFEDSPAGWPQRPTYG